MKLWLHIHTVLSVHWVTSKTFDMSYLDFNIKMQKMPDMFWLSNAIGTYPQLM